jgi:hypothetical protein
METNRKTIQINPELFKINGGGNTTRKKEKSISKIRIKTKKPKNLSIIKKNILKMIRNQQDERHKNKKNEDIFVTNTNTNTNDKKTSSSSSSSIQEFQNNFNDSLEFLSNLTKEVDNKKQTCTIKRYPSLPEPTYGCLKNGKLPTYRTWINQNQTRKQQQPIIQMQPQIQIPPQPIQMQPQIQIPPQPILPQQQQIIYSSQLQQQSQPQVIINNPSEKTSCDGLIKKFSKIKQFDIKNNQNQNLNLKKWKYPKQKKTIRRTYFVGRSRIHPRISVLVSNKTIRARTTLKQQELKQVPITEVKKYLLKHGFIKVGTSSPNDVLRGMYENAQLICGEIKNHNSENLLYNYFNAPLSELI